MAIHASKMDGTIEEATPMRICSTDYSLENTAKSVDKDPRTSPSPPWTATARSFGRWMLTPLGFGITIYDLNVIAWGGMLFLLLCNAAPAMCHPSCNSLDSPRRIWIEIDSQILNALFCVTGFGLAPWRVIDTYHWCFWRLGWSARTRQRGIDRLATIHAKWFLPHTYTSILPRTEDSGIRASMEGSGHVSPTSLWKMDVVVWGNMLNTVFQICLAVFMWAMNRFNRPSWSTGLFVCLACLVAAAAGIVMWLEKKRIRRANEHPGALLLVPQSVQVNSTPGS
ncbi:uncharacterized protein N7511_000090 [Penicillium nucicola]|uniref:uncharacterized protein n=1 Tax=Penicillium nucicola TaxID=1850975 RepID=UPI0025456F09|nr:uncharacterized protein N7511_000090 [Penicillium nucicola]KAJ5775079.1 hypothetical protein N7511_000090 [Penicillium nucicola]